MQSFENKPASPSQRLGASLNNETGYGGKLKASSPPRTPNKTTWIGNGNATLTGRALKIRTGPRETFLDDITPTDVTTRESEGDGVRERDSHDLSLSPQQITRHSIVDHMLLSLDQFSFGQGGVVPGSSQPPYDGGRLYPSFGDEDTYTSYGASQSVRRPGHCHSYSSDYEGHDLTRRPSSQLTRGRRSNSSSNYQTSLGRANGAQINNGSNGPAARQPQVQSRGLHSRSGKGSKGSSANSFDLGYAQITGTQRWVHGMAGRSSSFDFGQDRQMLNRQVNTSVSTFSPYDYDAAPTPTVPVGPRKHIPIPSNAPFQAEAMPLSPKTIERKRSTRSSKSAYKGSGDNANALGINFNYGKADNYELPPLPGLIKEAAPSPLVGYNKSTEPGQGNYTRGQAPPTKDRPGFFRRVFGSSKNSHPRPEVNSSHGSTASAETADRPSSKPQHNCSQMKPKILSPPREPPAAPKELRHTLTKKPSSFFRRRKKSISELPEAAPQPPPPRAAAPLLQTHHNREDLMLDLLPSPVSSLRRVMNPYLSSPIKSPREVRRFQDSQLQGPVDIEPDDLKGFSPGYELDRNATIRAVKPDSRDGLAETTLVSGTGLNQCSFDSRGAQAPSGSSSRTKDRRDRTFLQDSSDNDREAQGTAHLPASNKDIYEKRGASSLPPVPVSKDMTLVTECGQTQSKRSQGEAKDERAVSKDSLPGPVDSKPNNAKCSRRVKHEEWVMLTPSKSNLDMEHRVWLEPSSSEEDLAPKSNLSLPLEGARTSVHTSGSTNTTYKSATSLVIPTVEVDDKQNSSPRQKPTFDSTKAAEEHETKITLEVREPTEVDMDIETAKKIYDGNEEFVQKARAAAWLGDEGLDRRRTLVAYMKLYDFANLNILAALRLLCGRLILKGESQQVDRILDEFSKRWCRCNPNHGFKAADVVHTICYSLLLLNTDLYLADIDTKMTRSQFVKNTVPTIIRVVADSAPGAFESNRPSIFQRPYGGEKDLLSPTFKPNDDGPDKDTRTSVDNDRPSWRISIRPPARTDSDGHSPTPLNYNTPQDDCGPLVRAPFHGTLRTWEVQVEIVLKDFYNSIKLDRLPLFGAPIEKQLSQQGSSLSVFTSSVLRRTPSVLSKAPSEPQSYTRGRTADTTRLGTGRWTSKNRSRPRVYPSSAIDSSRTSLDDQSSMWSPSVSSSTWSKYSLGKTQTSMSVDSIGPSWPHADYQQSIGFANALSQAIIREETVGCGGSNYSDELKVAPLLEDESLELAGAPWAKEGIVKHKHHLEAVDKKAKDRNWNEIFAVIEKGYMSLFSFSSKSIRNKSRFKVAGGVVGGGNWQDNAENLGSFLLRQTIASALPPPGYSKARPHVWALSLPTGAVHLFQVGTPEIVREFVSTANYWSARLSNHPLVGGISNIEYGWSDAIINNPLVIAINETARPSTSGQRTSLQGSLRSSFDQGTGGFRSKLPGDRVMIADWTPPAQSMRASNLMERDQLLSLLTYVQGIEEELQKHNLLRNSMLLAFTPRHANAHRAMANWEKKSSYLLREIVKFRTYIDCLQAAEVQKKRVYQERDAEKALRENESEGEGEVTLMME